MRTKILTLAVAILALAAAVWLWGGDAPEGEMVFIDADYVHPVITLSVTPAEAAEQLQIEFEPDLEFTVEHGPGEVKVILADWEPGRDYTIKAELIDSQGLALDAPFRYSLQVPEQ